MSDYVQLPMTTNPADLEDIAIAALQTRWPGWTPNEADMEVVQIETLAPLAANAANIAANMPEAALIAFGTKLLGQPYQGGSPAYTTVAFTMMDSAGYSIPAGSEIEIDGFAFALAADAVTPQGQTVVNALVASTELTAAANGLIGASCTPISTPAWVIGMAVTAPTTNGSDPQTDSDYLNQISRDRKLTSRAIVTLLDFELIALDQPSIARAHAATTAPRTVLVTVLGTDGGVVSSPVKAALTVIYNDPTLRIANVTATVGDPTFTSIDVAYTVTPIAGFDTTDLIARCNASIAQELSPLGYGMPDSGDPGAGGSLWINDPVIRINRLISVIAAVTGVRVVPAVSLNGVADVDVTLTGAVALPLLGSCVGTIG